MPLSSCRHPTHNDQQHGKQEDDRSGGEKASHRPNLARPSADEPKSSNVTSVLAWGGGKIPALSPVLWMQRAEGANGSIQGGTPLSDVSEDEHRRSANEEPGEDVEAHRRHVLASDEPKTEGEESDEVEAHHLRSLHPKKV
jgi:hypothetical protein